MVCISPTRMNPESTRWTEPREDDVHAEITQSLISHVSKYVSEPAGKSVIRSPEEISLDSQLASRLFFE